MQATGYDSTVLSLNLNQLEAKIPSSETAYSSVQTLVRFNRELEIVFADISSVNLNSNGLSSLVESIDGGVLIK